MLNVEDRHAAVQEFADAFETGHLPPGLPKDVMVRYTTAEKYERIHAFQQQVAGDDPAS